MRTMTIWYMKPEHFREGTFGALPDPDITKTHVRVKDVVRTDPLDLEDHLECAYREMQAENWSRNGEARPLIEKLGLQHTSMSVGDVIQCGDTFHIVRNFGFEDLRELGWDGKAPPTDAA